MARKLKSDKLLFTATLLLICTSIVMVYSASAVIAREKWQDPYRFLFKQAAWVLIGLSLVPIVMRIDYRSYRQPIVIWTGLVVAVVALIGVLFAAEVNGASRWLHVGPLGVQPSELAKLAIILFTAALLERRMDRIDDVSYALLPIGLDDRPHRRAHSARARSRHRRIGARHRERDDLRRRHQLPVRRRRSRSPPCRRSTSS